MLVDCTAYKWGCSAGCFQRQAVSGSGPGISAWHQRLRRLNIIISRAIDTLDVPLVEGHGSRAVYLAYHFT